MASNPENHQRIVEAGETLSRVIQALHDDHGQARQHVLNILSALIANPATKEDVVSKGVVTAVQAMSDKSASADAISIMAYDISCSSTLACR